MDRLKQLSGGTRGTAAPRRAAQSGSPSGRWVRRRSRWWRSHGGPGSSWAVKYVKRSSHSSQRRASRHCYTSGKYVRIILLEENNLFCNHSVAVKYVFDLKLCTLRLGWDDFKTKVGSYVRYSLYLTLFLL